MPGGRSGLYPGIEKKHQSAQYKQYEAENDLLLDVGRDHLLELARAEKDGRLVVLEPAHAATEGVKKPTCFYNDMGQKFCLGFGRGGDDDEPIDTCKECWYCEFSSFREEAEAALKEREDAK